MISSCDNHNYFKFYVVTCLSLFAPSLNNIAKNTVITNIYVPPVRTVHSYQAL